MISRRRLLKPELLRAATPTYPSTHTRACAMRSCWARRDLVADLLRYLDIFTPAGVL